MENEYLKIIEKRKSCSKRTLQERWEISLDKGEGDTYEEYYYYNGKMYFIQTNIGFKEVKPNEVIRSLEDNIKKHEEEIDREKFFIEMDKIGIDQISTLIPEYRDKKIDEINDLSI